MTTYDTASDDKFVKLTIFCFQWLTKPSTRTCIDMVGRTLHSGHVFSVISKKKVISQWPRIYLVHYHTEISMLKWKVVIAPGLALAWHRSHTSNTWLATLLSGSPHVPIEVSHDSHAVSPGTMGCMSPHWEQVGKAADTFVAAEVTTGSNQDYKHWTFGQPNYFRW